MSPKNLIRLLVAVVALTAALAVQGVGQAASNTNAAAAKMAGGKSTAALSPVKSILPRLSIPVFKITGVKLYAADESGYDWAGSDEPMLTFTSATGNGEPHTVATPEYGDVDSGDTRSLNNMCVIASCTAGFSEPTTLSIQLFEIDQGDPETVRKRVEQAAQGVEWGILAYTGSSVDVPDWFVDYLTGLVGNDLMGSKTLRYDPASLKQRLTQVGSSFVERHYLGGNDGDLPWSVAGGPDYYLDLQITRLADKQIVKLPVASGVAHAVNR